MPLSHSIPEGNGLFIETPHGKVFHTGDWKIDETPVLGQPASPETLTKIGDEGVLALVCDSTNVFQDVPSGSEESVHAGLLRKVREAEGRVLVTTFASNAARLRTLGRVASEAGRRVVVAGRSLDRILKVAKATGYLRDFPEPVRFDEAMTLPRDQVLIIGLVSSRGRFAADCRARCRSIGPEDVDGPRRNSTEGHLPGPVARSPGYSLDGLPSRGLSTVVNPRPRPAARRAPTRHWARAASTPSR